MSRSSKKITFNMLATTVGDTEMTEIMVDEKKGISLNVRKYIGFNDAVNFVRSIAEGCFDDNNEYMPEAFDILFAVNVMMFYAGVTAPDDFEKVYRVIMHSNIYDMVLSAIDMDQIDALRRCAKERVKYMKDVVVQTKAGKINELVDMMSGIMRDTEAAASMIDSDQFKEIMKMMPRQETSGTAGNNITEFHPEGE